MSNVIQIKRGNGAPGDNLAPYELGYDTSGEYLYVGQAKADGTSDNAKKIKAGYADAATKIVDANGTAQSVGSRTSPIYLSQGQFVSCSEDSTIPGTIEYAEALNPGKKIGADLTKNESVNFTGAQDIVIGVTGILPVSKGGTGVASEAALKILILNMAYPVGSIYMSTKNNSPEKFLGGKWIQIKDTFLLAAGSKYTAGTTGGEASHTHEYGFVVGDYYRAVTLFNIDAAGNETGALDKDGNPVGWEKRTNSSGSNIDLSLQANGGIYSSYSSKSMNTYESKGETPASSNLPPYLTVYMWQRMPDNYTPPTEE